MSESGTIIENYTYLGYSTVVQRGQGDGVSLTSIAASRTQTADAGDPYIGLDRFGRVVDQKWVKSGTAVDEYTYTYDADSNVTAKRNALQPPTPPIQWGPYDEGYTYDSLNRRTAVSRNGSSYQSFTLNAVGDITVLNGVSRTVNSANQVTQIGSNTMAYDNNGNLTTDDQGHTLVYDAWNRVVAVYNGSTLLASYSYDGGGRRITSTVSGTTTDFYVAGTQDIEDRQGGTTTQTVFSPVYVNAPILRDSGGTRVYFSQDANFNVTGVFNSSGNVTQRTVYDSGGTVSFKTNTWGNGSNSQNVTTLFQGMRYDASIGWYFVGNTNNGRLYSPTMEVWNRPDIGYLDSMSLYEFCADNPINKLDPSGLLWTINRDPEKPMAEAIPGYHDTIATLANQLNLNVEEARKWLDVIDGPEPDPHAIPHTDSDLGNSPCNRHYYVPNTVYIDKGHTVNWALQRTIMGFYGSIFTEFETLSVNAFRYWSGGNFHVVVTESAQDDDILAHLRTGSDNKDLYAYYYFGDGNLGSINAVREGGVGPAKYTAYGIAGMYLYACDTATGPTVPDVWRFDAGEKHTMPPGNNLMWRLNVSKQGAFLGFNSQIGLSDYNDHEVGLPGLYEPDYPRNLTR